LDDDTLTVRAAEVGAGAVNTSTAALFAPESGIALLDLDVHVRPVLETVWVTLPLLEATRATRRLPAGAVNEAVVLGVVPEMMAGVVASIAIATADPLT